MDDIKYEVYGISFKELDEGVEWEFDKISKEELYDGEMDCYAIYEIGKEVTTYISNTSHNLGWIFGYIHAKQPIHKTNFYRLVFPVSKKTEIRIPYLSKTIQEIKRLNINHDKTLASLQETKTEEKDENQKVETLTDFCLDCPHYFNGAYSDACADCVDGEVMLNGEYNDINELVEDDNEQKDADDLKYNSDDLKKLFEAFVNPLIEDLKHINGDLESAYPVTSKIEEDVPFDIEELKKISNQAKVKFNAPTYFQTEVRPHVEKAACEGNTKILVEFDDLSVEEAISVVSYLRYLGFFVQAWASRNFTITGLISW